MSNVPEVLNMEPLDWKSSSLTTRPLLHKEKNLHKMLLESQFADVWRIRSIAAGINDETESVEAAKGKSKPTQQWVQYQLDELEKEYSSCNKKIMRKSSTIENMMYSYKNIEAVRNQMWQLDDIF